MKFRWIVGAFAMSALALTAAACGDDSGPLTISEVRGQTTLGDNGAIYFTIENSGETDYVVSARVLGDMADRIGDVQLHETVTDGGSMQMNEVDRFEIPGDGALALEPGGFHVMLLNIDPPIKIGDTIEVELTFEDHDPITIEAEVGPPGEDDMHMGDDHADDDSMGDETATPTS
jgi:copper(I)-binding protein